MRLFKVLTRAAVVQVVRAAAAWFALSPYRSSPASFCLVCCSARLTAPFFFRSLVWTHGVVLGASGGVVLVDPPSFGSSSSSLGPWMVLSPPDLVCAPRL